ncbi:MAG TPA: glycoside hydrolase family 2 protein [Dermatophilaceae bacterium]
MSRQKLHDGWTLMSTSGPVPAVIEGRIIPAQVPGSVHMDLLAAGLIPDPSLDRVEEELVWAHRANWRYALELQAGVVTPDERVDLVFDGLDTVATITLNGVVLGSTANMHRGYRFDVRPMLRHGANRLTVDFRSALEYAEQVESVLGRRAHTNTHPYNMVRKMACSFGWDWGPDFQTAGIWKPVRLERWCTARLAQVRPLVTLDEDGTGRVEVHVDLERSGLGDDVDLDLVADVAGYRASVTIPAGTTAGVVVVTVPDVDLWWPAGYGEHPLYDLDVLLAHAEGVGQDARLDGYARRVGFRTITVDTTPDEIGTPFTVVVNGRAIFAKGANWIPDDHFLTRITRDRLERRVDQAVGAHMNMLRVWGGGIYETEDFYDVCDERGMLVWQDFLFACAAYPEEEPIRSEVEAEARENVARLTPHASLALWNGGNENLWGYADWGWPEQLAGRTWGLAYYTTLLPAIVAELDPTRSYASGSPYSPGSEASGAVHPNDQHHGLRHEWDVWNRIDYTAYRDNVPRFCSEFGFQGPPTWATLTRWVHDEPLTPTSPAFLLHQKADDGNGKLDRGLAPHLPTPTTFEDWHWATQLNQARAVTFGIEHFRSWWPRTAGALVWQLNDCWPVTSWAAVDGDERPKPLWYALRHAYAPRLLTVQPRAGLPVLVAVNDDDAAWRGQVHLERQTFAGEALANASLLLDVPPRSVIEIGLVETLITPQDRRSELLVAAFGEVRTVHTFAEDLDLAYAPNALSADVVRVPEGYRVDVRASSFARDVAVLADRLAPDAVVDDMLVPLLAGEERSFVVRTAADLDPAGLVGPLVLRSVPAALVPVTHG